MRMGSNRRLANVKTRRETGLDYIMQSIDLHLAHVVGFSDIFKFNKGHNITPEDFLLSYHKPGAITNYELQIINWVASHIFAIINLYFVFVISNF